MQKTCWFFLVMVFATGCKTTSSRLKHDAGRFTNDETNFAWVEIDEATYVKLMDHTGAVRPKDDADTVRLQQWMDKIMLVLIKSSPALAQAPAPKVRIINNDKTINAFTSSVPSLLAGPIVVDKGHGDNAPYLMAPILAFDRQDQNLTSTADPKFLRPYPAVGEQKLQFLQWLFRGDSQCETSLAGDTLTIHQGCSYIKNFNEWATDTKDRNWSYKGLGFVLTHNYITVYSGLVKKMSDESVRGILAHELSHYLMGHSVNLPGEYNYFYEIGDQNSPHKPTPLPDSHPLAAVGKRIQQASAEDYRTVEGQSFHPLVSHIGLNLANFLEYSYETQKKGGRADIDFAALCQDTVANCYSRCVALFKGSHSSYDRVFFNLPRGKMPLTPDGMEQEARGVRQFEADLKQCFVNFKTDPVLAQSIEEDLKNVAFVDKGLVTLLKVTPLRDSNLLELFTRASQVMAEVKTKDENQKANDIRTALNAKLGWYTIEQEADEMAVEIMTRMGYAPYSFLNALLDLYDSDPHQPAGAAQNCRKALNDGFPTFVPPGDFKAIHGDPCFRVYNTFRELKAHESYYNQLRGQGESSMPHGN